MKDIQKLAETSSTDVSEVIPEIWSKEIQAAVRDKSVAADYVKQNEDLLNSEGDTVHIPKRKKITTNELGQDGTIDPSKLDYSEITLTPTPKGAGIKISRDSIQKAQIDIVRDATSELGDSIAEFQDRNILSEIAMNCGGTIDATTGLQPNHIVQAAGSVKQSGFTPDCLFINPAIETQIATADAFLSAGKYGSESVVREGLIGKFFGLDTVSTSHCGTAEFGVGPGTYPSLIWDSQNAVIQATKQKPQVEETYLPLERKHLIAADMSFDVKMLFPESACAIETTVQ